MLKKIKGYFKNIKHEKNKNHDILMTSCLCRNCSYFSKCDKAEKNYCDKATVYDMLSYVAIYVIVAFLAICICYDSFSDKMLDKGFTPQQIENIFTK